MCLQPPESWTHFWPAELSEQMSSTSRSQVDHSLNSSVSKVPEDARLATAHALVEWLERLMSEHMSILVTNAEANWGDKRDVASSSAASSSLSPVAPRLHRSVSQEGRFAGQSAPILPRMDHMRQEAVGILQTFRQRFVLNAHEPQRH